jgi:putative transposase
MRQPSARAGRPRVPGPASPAPRPRPRVPGAVISHAVWRSSRFLLSDRDVGAVLAERGSTVSHETVRRWCRTFGRAFADGGRRRPAVG